MLLEPQCNQRSHIKQRVVLLTSLNLSTGSLYFLKVPFTPLHFYERSTLAPVFAN